MKRECPSLFAALLVSLLVNVLLRSQTAYWPRAGLFSAAVCAPLLAGVGWLFARSWRLAADPVYKLLFGALLVYTSVLELLRLWQLADRLYPGAVTLTSVCLLVVLPVVYLRRVSALSQTAYAVLCLLVLATVAMLASVLPRLCIVNLQTSALTQSDFLAAASDQLTLYPEYLLPALWPEQDKRGRHTLLRLAGWALAFDVGMHLILELFYGAAMPLRIDPVHAAARCGALSIFNRLEWLQFILWVMAVTVKLALYLYALVRLLGGQSKTEDSAARAGSVPTVSGRHLAFVRGAAQARFRRGPLPAQCADLGLCGLDMDRRCRRMSVPKTKALLTVCAALLLCGCGQALSEREIVRAVFFARQQGAYSACLLLADQNAASGGVQYKTASARGDTAAQALHRAEDTLPGQLYYGLLDLAALPPDCDWADAQTLGTLLYDKAQPAPELSVFVLDTAAHSWAADAASLYEDMKAVEREYDLHCGLQQLFAQADGCAVPAYRADSGYDFALLAADRASVYVSGLQAQLAAALCGQTDRFFTAFAGGQAVCDTRVNVTVEDTTVQLHLRDTDFQPLVAHNEDWQALLCTELQQAFSALTADDAADFFHLQFWHVNLYGPGSALPAPRLEILLE